MKIKGKNIWLWSIAVLAVALVATWASWPEYGEGYSEDQRRNWNEMVEATVGENIAYGRALSFNSLFEEQMKMKRSEPDALVWKVDITANDSKNIPLEGMSFFALRQLADKGNGDACLELVFREYQYELFDDVSERHNKKFIFPNVEFVYYVERYLKRAVESRRPGADFLLRLFEFRKNGDHVSMQDIAGYKAFASLLDEGDFALAKVIIYFDLNDGAIWSRVKDGLRKKVAQGDIIALRNYAYWTLFERLGGSISAPWMLYSIGRDPGSWVMSKLQDMEVQFPDWAKDIQNIEKTIDQWRCSGIWRDIQSQTKIPLAMLCEGSDREDLHAKFLWCWYTANFPHVFSRDEWERYMRNVADLARAGGMYQLLLERELLPGLVCYQEESVRHVLELMEKRREKMEGMNREVGVEGFSRNDFSNILDEGYVNGEEKAHLFRMLEKGAKEGSPLSMICLAVLLERGKDMPEDAERAWDLLQKAKACRDGIHGEIAENNTFVRHYNRNDEKNSFWNYWEEGLPWQMIDIVTRRGDMPGMTVQQAYDLFMGKLNNQLYRANHPDAVKILEEQFEKRGFKVPNKK